MIEFTGNEWSNFLKQFSVKQLRSALKGSYRSCGKKVRAIAVEKLRESSLHVQGSRSDWEKGVRLYNYTNGSGFMVTVKGVHGKSMHETRAGRLKPILMFAEDGTKKRVRRKRIRQLLKDPTKRRKPTSGSTGAMPAYHFLEKATLQMYRVVENDIARAVGESVEKVARKAGF